MGKTVKVGMVGTGFVGDLHHAAFKGWVHNADVVAVASPHNAAKFAEERGIASHYSDYCALLKDKEIDVVDIEFPYDPPKVSKPIDLWKRFNLEILESFL